MEFLFFLENDVPILGHLVVHIRQCSASEVVKVWTSGMESRSSAPSLN